MFNKLKQIKDLKDQAKTMQTALATVSNTVDKHGVFITMNGNMEVTDIKLPEEKNDRLSDDLKWCFNEAVKKTQFAMAKKMQEMGNMPGLSDLLK